MRSATDVEEHHLQIDSSHIYYQVTGSGKPLVLIHGLSGSSRWWARNISPLAEHFRVYVVDLIGFGKSRAGQHFVLSEAAKYLTAWMDRLDIQQASFVGHSMGAIISIDLAADFPDRVDRLVLVDAAAVVSERSLARNIIGLIQTFWYLPAGFWPVLITDALRAGPITILRAARELLITDIDDKLPHIHAPTLILWGEHDAAVPREVGEKLYRCLLDARFTVIDSAGHNPMWDCAEPFNQAVIRFLD